MARKGPGWEEKGASISTGSLTGGKSPIPRRVRLRPQGARELGVLARGQM